MTRHDSSVGKTRPRCPTPRASLIFSAELYPHPQLRSLTSFGRLGKLTDNVLFGDVRERPEMSKRDRSLLTVGALIAMNRPDRLRSHLARARENGVKQGELIGAVTHPAFYAGWPNAMSAITLAGEVFREK